MLVNIVAVDIYVIIFINITENRKSTKIRWIFILFTIHVINYVCHVLSKRKNLEIKKLNYF